MKLYTEDDGEARGWLPGGQLHTDLLVLLRVYLGWRYQARLQLTLPVSLLPPAQLGNQRVQVSRTGVQGVFCCPSRRYGHGQSRALSGTHAHIIHPRQGECYSCFLHPINDMQSAYLPP